MLKGSFVPSGGRARHGAPPRARRGPGALGLALGLVLFAGPTRTAPPPAHMHAPPARPAADTAAGAPAAMPFREGETLTYQVTLGPLGTVGHGSLAVAGVDTVRGVQTYRLQMRLRGGIPLAHVNDSMESWVDPESFHSLRFHQDLHEVNYRKTRTLDFYPTRMRWIDDRGASGKLGSDRPLDDISFIYFARTLPLRVGRTYTYNRYFSPNGNPVTLKVLRRDTVNVPAGRFATIVVRPIIRTKGLFGRGGRAELYFTDDSRRLLVQMKSHVPIIGSLGLQLVGYTPGAPSVVHAAGR